MIDYDGLYRNLAHGPLASWGRDLPGQVAHALGAERHGEADRWRALLARLPRAVASSTDFDAPAVRIGTAADLEPAGRTALEQALRSLHPWRKGPFDVFGIRIDAEWRSDHKWARLAEAVQPLRGRMVLDVGCGNGYYALRMLGAGAAQVIGIDPTLRYVVQFAALRHYLGDIGAHVLPLGIDDLPAGLRAFDSVFSMGVLYHRRSPLDHLLALRGALRPGGELVLETLVIDGAEQDVLLPPGRYAQMRNVWFLPSVAALQRWLERCGFTQVRTVDVSATTVAEQRTTSWMQFQSLADFLDPSDHQRTVEGLPAPRRALTLARAS